jgi:hypothetical protein
LIDIQKLSDEELDELEKRYEAIRKACEARRAARTSSPEADADKIINDGMRSQGPAATRQQAEKPAA